MSWKHILLLEPGTSKTFVTEQMTVESMMGDKGYPGRACSSMRGPKEQNLTQRFHIMAVLSRNLACLAISRAILNG